MAPRFWLQLAPKVDTRRLVTDFALEYHLVGVDQVGIYNAMLDGHPDFFPNDMRPTGMARHVLTELSAARIPVQVEIGAVKNGTADIEFLNAVEALETKAKGLVSAVGMDEPIRYSEGRNVRSLANALVRWIRAAKHQGLDVTWYEATPYTRWDRQKSVMEAVLDRVAVDRVVLDIDGRAIRHFTRTQAQEYRMELAGIKAWCNLHGIHCGCTFISPSLPRRRSFASRVEYALRDKDRVGYRQAWSDGAERHCSTLQDFQESVAEQTWLVPFDPDIYDFHSWELGWAVPSFQDHIALFHETRTEIRSL